MPRKPDTAFIERDIKLSESITTATSEQVKQLVSDAQPYGQDSVEMAYALATKGRMARWLQEDLRGGADSLQRAVALAETHGLGPEICARWVRTLSVVCDDLGEAQRAIDAAEKTHALNVRGRLQQETTISAAALVHTMRIRRGPRWRR